MKLEKTYKEMLKELKTWDLKYTIGSCDFVLNKEDTTLIQLRRATFINSNETSLVTDYIKATRILIEMGLLHKESEYTKLYKLAIEKMETWISKFGAIEILHLLLIRYMENLHFFIDSQDLMCVMTIAKEKMDDLAVKIMIENKTILENMGVLQTSNKQK